MKRSMEDEDERGHRARLRPVQFGTPTDDQPSFVTRGELQPGAAYQSVSSASRASESIGTHHNPRAISAFDISASSQQSLDPRLSSSALMGTLQHRIGSARSEQVRLLAMLEDRIRQENQAIIEELNRRPIAGGVDSFLPASFSMVPSQERSVLDLASADLLHRAAAYRQSLPVRAVGNELAEFRGLPSAHRGLPTASRGGMLGRVPPLPQSSLDHSVGSTQSSTFNSNNRLGAGPGAVAQPSVEATRTCQPPLRDGTDLKNEIYSSNGPLKFVTTGCKVSLKSTSDNDRLSQCQVKIREQLEYFVAQQEDADSTVQGRKKQVVVGQVGIRCMHCSHMQNHLRERGAVYYPARLDGIYQAAQNMAVTHILDSCDCVPASIRKEIQHLREQRSNGTSGGKVYWARGARELGICQTDNGLRLLRLDSRWKVKK